MSEPSTKQESSAPPVCPHCKGGLSKWRTPEDSTWAGALRLVCFNDDCSYFEKGWQKMMETQAVCISYRYLLDPVTGYNGPLAVWSKDACRENIEE